MNLENTLFNTALIRITTTCAVLSLITGLKKGSVRTHLLLGILDIFVGTYYYFSHFYGTEEVSHDWPYRVSFFLFIAIFALLPWIFSNYRDYKKPCVQSLPPAGMVLTYLLLLFTSGSSSQLMRNIAGYLGLHGFLAFGNTAGEQFILKC